MINTGIGKIGFPFGGSNKSQQGGELKITDDFVKTIKVLSDMSRANGTSIKVETQKFSLHISPFSTGGNSSNQSFSSAMIEQQVDGRKKDIQPEPPQQKQRANSEEITSPFVGTVYLGPSPGRKFVEIGEKVKKGDYVLIVETMKVMNNISAPCNGVVSAIHVANEQSVEYGQVLIEIEKE